MTSQKNTMAMKNVLKAPFIFLLVSLFTFQACEDDDNGLNPRACLQADKNFVAVGEVVTFTDCSEEAARTIINFGDDTYSNSSPVEHVYTKEGIYQALLKAYSANSEKISESVVVITVGATSNNNNNNNNNNDNTGVKPTACFSASTTLSEPGREISFINCSLNASEFNWTFGDGGSSTSQNPTHTYTRAGIFNVTLTVSNNNGQVDTLITIKVGERVLNNIILVNFNPLDPSGQAWDALPFPIPGISTDPDIFIEITSVSGSSVQTAVDNNTKTSDLPISWDVSSGNVLLTDENWTVTMFDDEGFFASPVTMHKWDNVNLGLLGGDGIIRLTSGSFTVDLEYVIQ